MKHLGLPLSILENVFWLFWMSLEREVSSSFKRTKTGTTKMNSRQTKIYPLQTKQGSYFILYFIKQYLAPCRGATLGFPGASDSKEFACNAGDTGSIPGLGRSPGGRNGNPLQYSHLENSMDRGDWQATVHGLAKNRTQLSTMHGTVIIIIILGYYFSPEIRWISSDVERLLNRLWEKDLAPEYQIYERNCLEDFTP